MKRIVIIGGGAAGIMAAISAARKNRHAQIFLIEQKDQIGKKILATGNGRCNLMNLDMDSSYFRGDDLSMVAKLLESFGTEELLRLFDSIGLVTKCRGSYVYPRADQAQAVLQLLCAQLKRLNVRCHTGLTVKQLQKNAKGFIIHTDGPTFHAEKVILACGGKASSALGSDGSGYTLAKSMGHTLSPVVPALVQLKVRKHPFAKASGVRTQARVCALVDGKALSEDCGELQITAYGISGIPVFQISRFIAKGLYAKKNTQVSVDFLPDMGREEFQERILLLQKGCPAMTVRECMLGVFPQKLGTCLVRLASLEEDLAIQALTPAQIERLSDVCKQSVLSIFDTNGFENAQVCAGGVRTTEISYETLESRYVNGLYLAGELLDIDGICGGYNLFFAFATGYLAGSHAAV